VTLPALLALRRRFPDASIEAIGNAIALPIAEANGLVDRWLPFDDGRVTRLFMPAAPPPDDPFLGIDVAIAWGRDADGTLARALTMRGAKHVIVAPSRPDPSQPEHVARHLLRSLVPLGIEADADHIDLPDLQVPGEADTLALAELAAAGLAGRPFVAIHPGSGSAAKNWPAEQYAEVVDRLQGEYGLASIILGGPADAHALVMVNDRADQPPSAVVERPLLVVAALLRRAAAFLGNDSGLAHLAGLLGTPTLALFGPSDPTLWAPLGPRARVLHAVSLAALPADTVLTELTSLIGG
jgi:ADP-heptose:LPS heptosyltransferase